MRVITLALILAFSTLSLSAQLYAPFRFEHDGEKMDLLTIMGATNTPDLSVAFEHDGGDTTFTASINEGALSANTIFPVGAASSAPMIVLVLQLVEKGTVKLDAPINDYISSVEVPLNKGQEITVRDLLLMKPKFGSGYKPKGFNAGEEMPTLVDLARQLKPKGTRKVDKGTEHGGWVLIQLMLQELYGEDLQTIANREIFKPLCLEDMFYASELPASRISQAAVGHNEDGSALQAASGFEQRPEAVLTALDRRIYLDLHPYRKTDGSYAISYALFSQFNCHTPVSDNFGAPVIVNSDDGTGVENLAAAIATDLKKMLDVGAGFVPRPVAENISLSDWSAIGFGLAPEVASSQSTEAFRAPVSVAGKYRAALSASDSPGLYFSFPSPLDRYSGEVRELTADFEFDAQNASVSGSVALPVAAIATGSGSLDTYVLGDILRSNKYPSASLKFDAVELAGNWFPGVTKEASIPARLTVRGKTFPVAIDASFTPDEAGALAVTADFELDFKAVFGSPGPDGPDDIRRRLGFQAAFELNPGTLK